MLLKHYLRQILLVLTAFALTAASAFSAEASEQMTKGLLVQDPLMLEDAEVVGTEEIIYNITSSRWLSHHYAISLYLAKAKSRGIKVTVVLLNDRQSIRPALLPETGGLTGNYYFFNIFDDAGRQATAEYIRSVAEALGQTADRYIIGNEIQDQLWNCIGKRTADAYTDAYAAEFRMIYDIIRSVSPSAEVYIPFDYGWCVPGNDSTRYQGRDCLTKLNQKLGDTDYGIAWHAYPDPLTSPVFWDDAPAEDQPDAYIVNLNNLHVLTDFMQLRAMLRSDGSVRNIILSEQGFTSLNGGTPDEELQAAAYAYGYFIAEKNPYIRAFILNRQVDAKSEVSAGRAFGLWSCDMGATADETPLAAKKIYYVFRDIDHEETNAWIRELVRARVGIDP